MVDMNKANAQSLLLAN